MEKCDETTKRLQERLKKWELKKTEKVFIFLLSILSSFFFYIWFFDLFFFFFF